MCEIQSLAGSLLVARPTTNTERGKEMTINDGKQRQGVNYTYPSSMEQVDKDKHRKISQDTAELCVFYLEETAEAHAAWSARRKFLEKHIAVVQAIEESKQQAGSATDKARVAKKSPVYQRSLRDLEEAIYHETLLSSLRDAADMKFKGWQSLNANVRAGIVS